jgi:hypothetical protein
MSDEVKREMLVLAIVGGTLFVFGWWWILTWMFHANPIVNYCTQFSNPEECSWAEFVLLRGVVNWLAGAIAIYSAGSPIVFLLFGFVIYPLVSLIRNVYFKIVKERKKCEEITLEDCLDAGFSATVFFFVLIISGVAILTFLFSWASWYSSRDPLGGAILNIIGVFLGITILFGGFLGGFSSSVTEIWIVHRD